MSQSNFQMDWWQRSLCCWLWKSKKKKKYWDSSSGVPSQIFCRRKPGLLPRSDCKVHHGRFWDRSVFDLKHVPDSQFLVTSGLPLCYLQWDKSQRTVISLQLSAPLLCMRKKCVSGLGRPSSHQQFLESVTGYGWLSGVKVVYLESQKTTYTSSVNDSKGQNTLQVLDGGTFAFCCTSGAWGSLTPARSGC